LIAASTTPASAACLFFFKGQTRAINEEVCLDLAENSAKGGNPQGIELQNVKRDDLQVSGTQGELFAVITCVGTFVVVMVAGNPGRDCRPLAQQLFDSIPRFGG
jgi:hypothetical protein